jgi:hypothetical protein
MRYLFYTFVVFPFALSFWLTYTACALAAKYVLFPLWYCKWYFPGKWVSLDEMVEELDEMGSYLWEAFATPFVKLFNFLTNLSS